MDITADLLTVLAGTGKHKQTKQNKPQQTKKQITTKHIQYKNCTGVFNSVCSKVLVIPFTQYQKLYQGPKYSLHFIISRELGLSLVFQGVGYIFKYFYRNHAQCAQYSNMFAPPHLDPLIT